MLISSDEFEEKVMKKKVKEEESFNGKKNSWGNETKETDDLSNICIIQLLKNTLAFSRICWAVYLLCFILLL